MKQGFSGPDGSWFKGESLKFVEGVIGNPKARIYEFLDRETVTVLVKEHTSGKHNRRLFLWSLLNLETWLATFS
jgi:asparagine synthase (glutamine-hydrolysing)